MSFRTVVIGVLALLFGGSAAIGVNLLYRQTETAPATPTVAVVIAKTDIPRGAVLSAEQVKTREFPIDLVPPGAITNSEDVLGRVVFHSLVRDEPLLERKLSPKNAKGGMAGLVPKGMRAFTIQTNNVAGQVAGFVLPGNHVDVLLTTSGVGREESTGGAVTTTLLQNVEILAVDQRLDAPSENRVDTKSLQSVTLLVTPDQANKLDLGQNRGTLHLALRNPEDSMAAKAQPATLMGLQFYSENPWIDKAKAVIDAFTKKLDEKRDAKKASAQVDAPATPLEIRTLRGTNHGVVRVEPVGSSDTGR